MGHDRIVIGASAGGILLLKQIVASLPEKLGAAVFIVVHTTPHLPSKLAVMLDAAGPLRASFPEDGEPILPDRIYVAPPDNHMLVRRGRINVVRGPKENFTRPAIDPTFRSAAISYGPRVIGVVLSGALDDGTAGLVGITARSCIVIVKDPNDAEQPSMPLSALEHVSVDHCVGGAEIGPLLVSVARQPAAAEDKHPIPDWLDAESQIAEAATMQSLRKLDDVGVPSRLSCPECGGVMYETKVDDLLRFRCRVGHAYSSKSLLADQAAGLEASLWAGVRALEESALLMERLSERVTRRSGEAAAAGLRPVIEARKRQADDMRRFIKTALSESSSSAEQGL